VDRPFICFKYQRAGIFIKSESRFFADIGSLRELESFIHISVRPKTPAECRCVSICGGCVKLLSRWTGAIDGGWARVEFKRPRRVSRLVTFFTTFSLGEGMKAWRTFKAFEHIVFQLLILCVAEWFLSISGSRPTCSGHPTWHDRTLFGVHEC